MSSFVRVQGMSQVYEITNDNKRRWIPDTVTFRRLSDWDQVRILATTDDLKAYPPDRPIASILNNNGVNWLVRIKDTPEAYLIDTTGNRHYIPDGQTLDILVSASSVGVDELVDWDELELFPLGDQVPSLKSTLISLLLKDLP